MILEYAHAGLPHYADGFEVETEIFDNSDFVDGNFSPNMNSILKFAQHAKAYNVSKKFPINVDVILLPSVLICCGKSVKMGPRFAKIILYCDNEVRKSKSYHGKCSGCNKIYYHTYWL